jgi:flagellar hook-basal body complex protein FliE
MSIDALNAVGGYGTLAKALRSEANPMHGAAAEFGRVLDGADQAAKGFAAGETSAQGLVEAIAQAEMALQTAVTIRDRIVGAYQEVLRMPL